jgi:hypothetical protein
MYDTQTDNFFRKVDIRPAMKYNWSITKKTVNYFNDKFSKT